MTSRASAGLVILACAGLAKDCPFKAGEQGQDDELLTAESVMDVSTEDFKEYASRLYAYLQVPLQVQPCHLAPHPWATYSHTSAILGARQQHCA